MKKLWTMVALLVVVLVLLTWIDLPILERLSSPHYIEIGAE